MKRRIIGFLIAAFGLLFVLASRSVRAGEINSAEQRLIAAVSGSFSYNGKSYVVKSGNIAEGRSKLAEDGVDLTEAEADSYIAQFHDSYEELVEEGYCNEVGGSSQNRTDRANGNAGDYDQKKNPASKHTKAERAKNDLFIRTVLGEPVDEKEVSDKGNAAPTSEPVASAVDSEWMEEEDLGTILDFEQADIAAAKEQKLILRGSDQEGQITITAEPQISSKGQRSSKNPLDQLLHMKWWKTVSYIIFGFAFFTALGIFWYILVIRNHKRKKRKTRLGLAVAAGISMAGCAFLLMLVLGLYFGIYNREAIHRQLMESDYYSGITQMTRELAAQKLQEAGYEEQIAAEVFSLSHVYIEEKQYIDGILSGDKENEILVKTVESVMGDQLKEQNQEKKAAVIQEINAIYQNTLQFELGKVIRESKDRFLPWCYGVSGVSCLFLLLLFGLTYQMYGYLHKSARVSSIGIFLSSLLVTGVSLAVKWQRFAERIQAEPIYYQQFLQKYANWSINVMFYVGCIGILAAAALTVWKRYLHMIYVD